VRLVDTVDNSDPSDTSFIRSKYEMPGMVLVHPNDEWKMGRLVMVSKVIRELKKSYLNLSLNN